MTWTLGLDEQRGPAEEEAVGTDRPAAGESVYYGPPLNGNRRQFGIAPPNGRNIPYAYPVQTGIGGRSVTQPVLNGTRRVPWHQPLNGTVNPLGIAQPNGFGRPQGLSAAQFGVGADDE